MVLIGRGGETMNAFAIIRILIAFALAYAAVSIADKKGYYSKVGFFFYGLICPLIAIIHAGILPDRGDSTKRQYPSKALLFNILAVIFSFYSFWLSGYEMYGEIVWRGLAPFHSVMEALYNLITVMGGLLPLLLLVSLLLGRKYLFSIFVYVAFAIKSFFELIRQIIVMSKEISFLFGYKEFGGVLFHFCSIAGTILVVIAYVELTHIGYKYGVKNERTNLGKLQPIFVLPGLLVLISIVLTLIGNVMANYPIYNNFLALLSQLVIVVPMLIFLGLFYYHDSQEIT